MPLDSASALNALRDYIEKAPRTTAVRGAHYAQSGRVGPIRAEDDTLSASVNGSSHYDTTLTFLGKAWAGDCTCAVGFDCKHCHALALAWRARRVLVGGALRDSRSEPIATGMAKAGKKSFREEWAPVAAGKLGRALTSDESRLLGHLSAIFQEMRQHWGRLHATTLRNHGFDVPALKRPESSGWVYTGWWDAKSAPADPWALWQYLAYDYERAGRAIPEVLAPFTDTAGIRERLETRLLEKELGEWRELLVPPSRPHGPDAFREKPVAGLRLRLTEADEWRIEVRTAPDKPFKDPAQKWMRGLGSTVVAADFAGLTPAENLLGMLLLFSGADMYGVRPGRASSRLVDVALAQAAVHPAMALPDGSPLEISAEPLAWQAAPDPDAPERLRFELVDAAGESASEAELVPATTRPFYLWRGKLHHGPAPLGRETAPLSLLDDAVLRTALRERSVRLPQSLALKFRRVTARATIECEVDYDAPMSMFRARLFAVTDDPATRQRFSGGTWKWENGYAPPGRRKNDDPIWEVDRSGPETVAATFEAFRLNWSDYQDAWVRSITRNFPEEFLAWRAMLPASVDIQAGPELAGLLGGPLQASADFSAMPAESYGMDWFDLTLSLRVEDTTLTPEEISLLLRARGKWVHLPKRGWQRIELTAAGDTLATLDRLGVSADEFLQSGQTTTHRMHALQLAGEADAFAARDAAFADSLRARAATIAARPAPGLPAGLTATLRPYQLEGFHYLAHLSHLGFGGVLADDMGLGKTVQTLAWLLFLAESRAAGAVSEAGGGVKRTRKTSTKNNAARAAKPFRALIVCPKSVVHGWLTETARFTPPLVAIAFVPGETTVEDYPPGPADGPALIIAHYTQLRLHAEWFQKQSWDAVVLDEAQFIKNPASRTALVARALPSAHRIALTGTPIENRLLDLWSLFSFAQPGLLGTQAAFKRQHPDADPGGLARLRRRVRHFMLRRTKSQVATDLPARTEDELVVELEDTQRRLYEAELKRARAQLLGVQTDRALDSVRFNILASLLRLRQICCHPGLIDPAYRAEPSAKLEALVERVTELRDEGHQVLVFSQFVEMLEIVRERLLVEKIDHLMLTGRTENRAELVDEFQRDRSRTVFLLSLKAAGSGLNLTAASYVILYDPWWNPAVEAQAIDRTHRIGQTQPVVAYRLLAANTIEEKIRRLQRDKAALATAVVQEESLASVLDLESLREILA